VRLGTPAVTSRGLRKEDMKKVGELIYLTASDYSNKADYIRAEVNKLTEKYPLYE
jgi:glycine hydroxymethyltransferase